MHVRRSVLATATAFVVVLAACGSVGEDTGGAVATSVPPSPYSTTDATAPVERRPAEDTFSDIVYSSEMVDDDRIFYVAPMVVVGTVQEVTVPYLNFFTVLK